MVRNNKPYSRPETQRRANPDAGPWKHDLHESVKQSLASRISSSRGGSSSSSSRPSLLDRISGGQGKELFPSDSSGASKLHGFGSKPPINPTNPNAGLELFPAGGGRSTKREGPLKRVLEPGQRSLVSSGLDAALGRHQPRITPRSYAGQGVELLSPPLTGASSSSGFGLGRSTGNANGNGNGTSVGSVSIMGAAKGTVWIRVENLAQGTTADDVVSAFSPSPILTSRQTSPSDALTVTVELELASRTDADDLVKRYHGAVADGNTLSVTVIRVGLVERMQSAARVQAPPISAVVKKKEAYTGQELLTGRSSKLYSDTILASNPSAAIITLADQGASQRNRAAAWSRDTPQRESLASRMGFARGAGARNRGGGRGQIGGGSFASMMVD
ncbi:hypothetical protein BCR39DRAFT_555494 [Naematelia encephala]|uniref:RRM domain-containing protein n=1 Tax=Naematelia encephala TaxID=71784 RepID=A0A1Y2BL57_9TREE|nr:hypothetical protein BCR39DRAFT_555494 [Naematelia encephala]